MKKASFHRLVVLGVILTMPFISFGQVAGLSRERVMDMHHEVPDDAYMPPAAGGQKTSPSASAGSTGFTMVQVNVDNNGDNILNDAANEPSIAINPQNPLQMVIGWRQFDNISSNFRQAGYGYTTDGGLTWTFPGVIEGGIFRSDPVLDYDSAGTIYYNSLTANGDVYTTKVFKSFDGGANWDEGAAAYGGDKQWMAIDRTKGIGENNIYSSWNAYYSSCLPGFFTRSTDQGATFENCVEIPVNPYWGTMAVGNDGELYLAGAGEFGNITVVKSNSAQDPAQTPGWDMISYVDIDGYLNGFSNVNPQGLIGQASICVDKSQGAGRGNVYVLASVSRFSITDTADVMFVKSTDGGLSWSAPMRINDDMGTNTNWFGTMSVAPNGRIDAIWLDTRDATPDNWFLSALYYSYSIDQGETWSANEKLTGTFDPHLGWPQQQKMGDYFDMESDDNSAYLAWANTFNLEEDVYFSQITPDLTGVAENGHENGSYAVSAYPNPFREKTTIRYKTPAEGHVTVGVYDVSGKLIRVLADGVMPAGVYTIDITGSDLPAGYYFCRLEAGSRIKTAKLVKFN